MTATIDLLIPVSNPNETTTLKRSVKKKLASRSLFIILGKWLNDIKKLNHVKNPK